MKSLDGSAVALYLEQFSVAGEFIVAPDGNKWYFIYDHQGNVRCKYTKNEAQFFDYTPFGAEINSNYNDPNGWISSERDFESQYMNLQARLYDPVIGRFLAVDPFSGTQVGISPYHYCYNDPINLKDVLGLFPPKDHANFGDWWLNSYWMDIFYSENAAIHFDNCPDFGAVKKIIDAAGGFGNLNPHTQGDFFSHSNYVDLWIDGGYSGVVPLWDEIDWNSSFGQNVRANLKTTSYHSSNYRDNDHDDGYRNGQFGAKDNLDDLLEIASGEGKLIERFTKLYNTAADATRRQMSRNRADAQSRQLQAQLALIQTAAFEAIMSYVNPVYRAARDLRNSYNASAADAFWMSSNASWSANMGMKSRNSWNGLWQSEGTNLFQSYMDEYISDMNSISRSYYMTGVSCKIKANNYQSVMNMFQ